MPVLYTFLLVAICFWISIAVKTTVNLRRMPKLPEQSPPKSDVSERRIAVIIPARNEEKDIEASVLSLLRQSGVKINITIVDDYSSDRTGEIADKLAKMDSRVKVLHNPPEQDGWLGKCNACQMGANITESDLLLFTDADIMHTPGTLYTALNIFEENNCDLLSLIPRFDVHLFWENAMLPMYFTGIALYLTADIHDPQSPEAAGCGAFILVKRTAFEQTGGFKAVRNRMYDDVEFTKNIKKNGFKVKALIAPESVSVEMFKTEKDAFSGTLKNVLMVGKGTPLLAIPALLLSYLMFWTPIAAVLAGIITGSNLPIVLGTIVYILQYSSFFLCRRYFRFNPFRALFFPLSTVVATYCILKALYLYYGKGTLEWRGRQIEIRNK